MSTLQSFRNVGLTVNMVAKTKTYLAESPLPGIAVESPPDIDPELVPVAEETVLSVCGAGCGIAAELSDTRESLFVELDCEESLFLVQLTTIKAADASKKNFINIYFG